ncbi:DUF4236 domain-containing protein [Cytobacillus oceanisediminis]|uniref:DUF4236 domain-containing protein n=1 Tax=Cytobacillus oceanisediminis TaxID=665099 RepID=UPI001FB561BB|nr:DUF4236 domain-containing protein [Cytobacillus oceanisediminis]UOE58204.1 DUF4236 domain-containing protein [Cytobacillus oceanisediminis]
MGFRFRKSVNLGGGVRLTAGKKGVGISAGTKGLRVSHGADGKTRVTASIPGTGISYQETIGSKAKAPKQEQKLQQKPPVSSNYQFKGIVRNKVVDGERQSLSVLLGQLCTVYINNGEINIISDNSELGGDILPYHLNQIKPEKNVRDRGFWIFKYKEVELKLTLETDSGWQTVYTLIVNEQVADQFMEWFERVKK